MLIQEKIDSTQLLLVVYVVILLFLFLGLIILFSIAYHRRKNALIAKNISDQKKFEAALATSKIETQEETLKNVGWELHDNIGQLLSVAQMQYNQILQKMPEASAFGLEDTLSQSLHQVRALSRALNQNFIKNKGLLALCQQEVERFNRLQFLKAEMQIKGKPFTLNENVEVFIFRIIQEAFSNIIKHARATHMWLIFSFEADTLIIIVRDNGKGFKIENTKQSGLTNMADRAALIKANFQIQSNIAQGAEIKLTLKKHAPKPVDISV